VAGLITTDRLVLVPATADLIRAALAGAMSLGEALGAIVPSTWPPEYLDDDALRYALDRLPTDSDPVGWWMHFVLVRPPRHRTLIGSTGYKGPPGADRTVEIGYGIVADWRRQGYATEAVGGLLRHAFAHSGVDRVIAETLPELAPSIGVLTKSGFRLLGPGSEPGVIRFEIARAEFTSAMGRNL
jgi:RimJ/RimL family protein N-acetyltransferase